MLPTKKVPESLIIAGLFLVCLTGWGIDQYSSQAFVLVVVAFCSLAFVFRDKLLAAAGAYLACQYMFLFAAASFGVYPGEVAVVAADSLFFGGALLVIYAGIRYGGIPADKWMNWICILATVLAAIGLVQYWRVGSASATLGCTNYLAAFLAISGPFFFRRKWWMLLGIVIPCLYATNTATAIAAFTMAVGFFFYGKLGMWAAFAYGLLYFLIFKHPSSLFERFSYWIDAAGKLGGHVERLIFGVGPGILWQADNMLHSEYAYAIWNFGIIGLIIGGLYAFRSVKLFSDRRITAAVIAILVDCFGNHLFHTAPTAFLAVAVFALNDRKLEE